ncbi:MAG: TRAP transporter permease [Treponema sp.]|nr:TRAP transporter permease [Treponema sp.]
MKTTDSMGPIGEDELTVSQMQEIPQASETQEEVQASSGAIEGFLPTTNEEEMKKLMKDLDKEQAYREHKCWRQWVTVLISICFVFFQLYAAISGLIPAQILRASHLAFIQLLAFLLFPASKKLPKDTLPWYDVVLAVTGAFCWLYIVGGYSDKFLAFINTIFKSNLTPLYTRAGVYTPFDIAIGIIGILVLFESCRRIVGVPIMVISGIFIIYAFVGKYIPGFLNIRGNSLHRVISHLVYTTEGIMGTPIGACSTFIFLFILFGALLEKTGIGQFFIDCCNAIAGGASGGPAKVAVLSSALLGTVSGSSVSNTVGSGSFTIPMMKKLGYKGEFAGAVEAAASTGGQLMPPIMGAAAFLMSESLGLPYLTIVKAAIIPAILYFTGIFITVHLEAKKLGLKGLPKEQLPKFLPLFLRKGYMILPLIIIIYFLCAGFTAVFAALMGIISCVLIGIVVSIVDLAHGRKPTFGGKDIIEVICAAARNIISVGIACAMAGIIIGIVTLTGIGLKLGSGLVMLAHGKLFLTLVFTMIASIILGMGAPTTANYLITSTITASAIVRCIYGASAAAAAPIQILPAHMFAFYFGIIADVTPPVALAAIAGAAIAKAKPMKTAVNATKLAIGAFIVPYMFVYNPAMLMVDATPLTIIWVCLTAVIGMFGISVGLEGYAFRPTGYIKTNNNALNITLSVADRLIFIVAGLLCIIPTTQTDIIGLIIMALLTSVQIILKVVDNKKALA